MPRTDQQIKDDVRDALAGDVRVEATGIYIEVIGGTVFLQGTVPSFYEKRMASDITSRIKGVVEVVNELKVEPVKPRADEDITYDVRESLRRDIWVDEHKIEVKTVHGVVHLSGTVDSYTEKSYAEGDAWAVPGVIDVANEIVIVPAEVRPDEELAADVRDELLRNIRIDPSQISVEAKNGAVYLRGSVATIAQKWLAEDLVWWIAGVRDVVNELRVELPAAA